MIDVSEINNLFASIDTVGADVLLYSGRFHTLVTYIPPKIDGASLAFSLAFSRLFGLFIIILLC